MSSPVFADNTNSFDIHIDHILSEHDQVFGRYSCSFLHRLRPGPFTGYADGGDCWSTATWTIARRTR